MGHVEVVTALLPTLISVEGIEINAVNRAGETAFVGGGTAKEQYKKILVYIGTHLEEAKNMRLGVYIILNLHKSENNIKWINTCIHFLLYHVIVLDENK
ncbi:hypothetical protein ACJX0J_013930, partial [Zea mays]